MSKMKNDWEVVAIPGNFSRAKDDALGKAKDWIMAKHGWCLQMAEGIKCEQEIRMFGNG